MEQKWIKLELERLAATTDKKTKLHQNIETVTTLHKFWDQFKVNLFRTKMFKDIFVQGSQAMISTLSWSGSTISGYPEPDSTLEMYEVPDGGFRKPEEVGDGDKVGSEDIISGRLSFVHQVRFDSCYLKF